MKASEIRPVIDQYLPLAEAAAAHTYFDIERKRGSVLLDMQG